MAGQLGIIREHWPLLQGVGGKIFMSTHHRKDQAQKHNAEGRNKTETLGIADAAGMVAD